MSGTTTHVDYLKRLTADLRRTRRRLSDLEAKLSEPVAVVGMGRGPMGRHGSAVICRITPVRPGF